MLWWMVWAVGATAVLEQPLHRKVHLFRGTRWQQLAAFLQADFVMHAVTHIRGCRLKSTDHAHVSVSRCTRFVSPWRLLEP